MPGFISGAVYAFNTKVSNAVSKMATDLEVEIKSHNVIYRLFDDVKVREDSRMESYAIVTYKYIYVWGSRQPDFETCQCQVPTV